MPVFAQPFFTEIRQPTQGGGGDRNGMVVSVS
jgi:hypothetical protein